ncbi:MAG: amino acid racemase [Saprospiraceae bacterium]|nr:amino acid racemase [Saprospiraceae bacterium]
MKQIGLIGGTSWFSTVEYYRYINQIVDERAGSNPPLLLYSLNIGLMRRGDWSEINETFLKTAQVLEGAGAEAIVICANTPHKVYPHMQPRIGIPILHIADAIGQAAQRQQLSRLGLLGTLPVVQGDFIGGHLTEQYGIKVLRPEHPDRTRMHKLVANELTRGIMTDDARAFTLQAMDRLRLEGADGIILGCTELPLLLENVDYALPLLDTTRLHAEMVADFILD